jgi:tRNA (adenine22-N1)-methyltransferase
MNHLDLSKRLAAVGEFVPKGAFLADIGSDHAYLPVALMLKGKIEFAVAGEVVKGPYDSAKKQVQKNGLKERIIVRLANGLDAIEATDQITTITIAGMGGSLIRDILEAGTQNKRLTGNERLILQPNIGEQTLRIWLQENQYEIIAEQILEENKKIYEIIVAEKSKKMRMYNEKEIMFGPILLQEKTEIFKSKWQREMKQRKRIVNQLSKATNQQERMEIIKQEIQWIEEALNEWQ